MSYIINVIYYQADYVIKQTTFTSIYIFSPILFCQGSIVGNMSDRF